MHYVAPVTDDLMALLLGERDVRAICELKYRYLRNGTFETCLSLSVLRMSVHQGRPEVAVVRSNRRDWTQLESDHKF